MKRILFCLAGILALPTFHAPAAEYLGASASLSKAISAAQADRSATEDDEQDSLQKLRQDLRAFEESKNIGEEESAREWLSLAYRTSRMGQVNDGLGEPIRFPTVVKALPSPAAWPALRKNAASSAKEAKATPAEGLAVTWFADRLLGQTDKLLADYDAIAHLDGIWRRRDPLWTQRSLEQLASVTLQMVTDRDERISLLNKRLDGMIAAANEVRRSGRMDYSRYEFPDVVAIVGEKDGQQLIARALTTYPGEIDFGSGRTREAAEEIALSNIDSLAAAQWNLSCSLENGELYERLLKKFGKGDATGNYREAQEYAFYRAILAGNMDLAETIARAYGPEFSPSGDILLEIGHGSESTKVLAHLLEKEPNAGFWRTYITFAVQVGEDAAMLDLLKATLAREDLAPELRSELLDEQLDALLATNQTDQAIAQIRHRLVPTPGAPSTGDQSAALSLKLAQLGALLDRKDWLEEGLKGASSALRKQLSRQDPSNATSTIDEISELLVDARRGPEAEALWIDVLGACIAKQKLPQYSGSILSAEMPQVMRNLVGIYAAAGRWEDVLTLVNDAPFWGVPDLATIVSDECYIGNRRFLPLGVCVARALATTGKWDEAVKLTEAMMPRLSGNDSAYALLLELRGQQAIPMLDRLAADDAFEERPLIWKAKLLLETKKLDEAEAVIRKAISIDPSDGEQGPGDRMRAYSVLAEILTAKGDTKQAGLYQGVVASIRMSEQADVFYRVGLLQRAIALYEESLTHFADAYCIQSRLALRLSESGHWKEAEDHYRRAYELMPDSFGRVESHCFGCERAFAGKPQQSIAESVFRKLAKEQPDKPQVHYLLGYLYEEEGRDLAAVPEYQRAVELDPDYLNAWKKLDSAPATALSPAERSRIALNIIRLDPAGKHCSPNLDGVNDLAAVWDQLTLAQKSLPHAPASLYPLPASARKIAELIATDPAARSYLNRPEDDNREPGKAFSDMNATDAVESMFQIFQSQFAGD
jgi:tetratricopeptide (TPR) repeat protein